MRTPHRTVEKRWWELVAKAPLLNHRRLVLHQPNPAACGFWYLDAAAAFLRISGNLSKTKQKQNKQTQQQNQKIKNRRKKLQQLQEQTLQ